MEKDQKWQDALCELQNEQETNYAEEIDFIDRQFIKTSVHLLYFIFYRIVSSTIEQVHLQITKMEND